MTGYMFLLILGVMFVSVGWAVEDGWSLILFGVFCVLASGAIFLKG